MSPESDTLKPPRCEHEDPASTLSFGVSSKACAALASIQPSEPNVCVTPLAGPVLPEVKKIAAERPRPAWAE